MVIFHLCKRLPEGNPVTEARGEPKPGEEPKQGRWLKHQALNVSVVRKCSWYIMTG